MKKFNEKFGYLGWVILICFISMGAIIGDNALRVGDRNAATNKSIKMGDGILQWNGPNSVLEFSNTDGSIFQDIGSGGGGSAAGVQLLVNADFELNDPPDNWSVSGGTFAAELGVPLFGDQSGNWDPSATAQNLDSDLHLIPIGLQGAPCTASFMYTWAGTLGDLIFEVLDSSSNVLQTLTLIPAAKQKVIAGFICPAVSARIRIRSTADTSSFIIDKGFSGEQATEQISSVEIVAEGFYATTASCAGWINITGAFDDYDADTDCPAITPVIESGGVTIDVTDNDEYDILLPNLPSGTYLVEALAGIRHSGTANLVVRVSDGTTFGPKAHITSLANVTSFASYSGVFTYTTAGSRRFRLEGSTSSGTSTILNDVTSRENTWRVTRYPTSGQNAISVDAAGFFLDVSIGGANITDSGNQTGYTELIDAGLDMVLNRGEAEIPCSSTNSSNGLTCSAGSESLGIVFDAPFSGSYRVCAEYADTVSGASARWTHQWIETPNNAQTILQEGGSRVQSQDGATSSQVVARHLCGIFDFASAGQKTLRIMYESGAVGAVTNILADRSATEGQRDVHITVEAIGKTIRSVTFPELVISKGANQTMNFCTFEIKWIAGVPTVFKDFCGMTDTLADTGTGDVGIPFLIGKRFSSEPNCGCNIAQDSGNEADRDCVVTELSDGTGIEAIQVTASTGVPIEDSPIDIWCHGPIN